MTAGNSSARIRFRRWRVRIVGRMLASSRTARTVFALATWPYAYLADRWQGVTPPASLREMLAWAREDQAAAIERVIRRLNEESP